MVILPESMGILKGDDPMSAIRQMESYIQYMTERINALGTKITKLEERIKELEGENGSITI